MSLTHCPLHGMPWKLVSFTAKTGKFQGQIGQRRTCPMGDEGCQPEPNERFVRQARTSPAPYKPTAGRGSSVAAAPDPHKNRRAALKAACLFFRDTDEIKRAAEAFEVWLERPFAAKVVPATQLIPDDDSDIPFGTGGL